MSIKGIPYGDHVLYSKSNHHRRNDSDELDVFEAAKYFSVGVTESSAGLNGAMLSNDQKKPMIIRDNERQALVGRRMSLDMETVTRNQLPNSVSHHQIQKQIKENKKYKQPSSPGAKLASFLNSLFNQNSSKNKKSSSKISTQTSTKEDYHHEEGNGMRRKRRSSISHFQSSINTTNITSIDHKKASPLYPSSHSAGFRTPPPYNTPPTKIYKDFRTDQSDDDHQSQRQVGSNLSKNSGRVSSISLQDEKNRDMDFSNWMELDEKFKFINGFSEKNKKLESKDKRRVVVDVPLNDDDDDDDGGESDSSSDLFELQNYHLGVHSSNDLPVFETTHIESIKRGPPISIS